MAIVSALSPTQMLLGRKGAKTINGITIDAYVGERYRHEANVTDYPIEDGSVISDHVTQKPDELTINGVVGPSPVYFSLSNFSGSGSVNRVLDTYTQLLVAKTLGDPITVVTGLRVYKNMVITSFDVERNCKNGQALEFTMQLKQVVIVKSQTGQMQPKQPQAQKKADMGGVTGTDSGNKMTDYVKQLQGKTPVH